MVALRRSVAREGFSKFLTVRCCARPPRSGAAHGHWRGEMQKAEPPNCGLRIADCRLAENDGAPEDVRPPGLRIAELDQGLRGLTRIKGLSHPWASCHPWLNFADCGLRIADLGKEKRGHVLGLRSAACRLQMGENGPGWKRREAVGETPTGATETVALPTNIWVATRYESS